MYSFSGSTADLSEGVFYQANNSCGNGGTCEAPNGLTGVADDEDIVLEWNGSLNNAYAYCIYRDDHIYYMATDNSQPFVDDETDGLGHCYNVSVLCENGESPLSNMVCVSVGESCNPARNLWYYRQDNGRPVITWKAPLHSDDVSAYFVYRKCNEDGEYHRVKIISSTKLEFKETFALEYGNWYYYKVMAYYKDIDCYSIPAKAKYGEEYFVKVWMSPESVDENAVQNVEVYPNPAKDLLTIKAENLTNVMIYNTVGQKVLEQRLDANELTINTDGFEPGIYLIRITADGNEITRKVSVIK